MTSDELVRAHAPGRVNLIGDHTDYAGGLAMPMAIDLATTVTGRRVPGRLRLRSAAMGRELDLDLRAPLEPATVEPAWGRYAAAVAAELVALGSAPATIGFDGTVDTTIPIGAGLSSSAALEVAVALALGAELPSRELALLGQRAEQRASGVPCGAMDQLTSVAGVEGHALVVDFRDLTWQEVPLPDDLDVVVVDSGQRRDLADSAYSQRRAEVERAQQLVGPLRDADERALAAIADPILRRRARHVVTEIARVRAFGDAVRAGDLRLAGAIVNEAHRSSRDDFECSTPVVDELVDRITARPGVLGARIVGGGFGGCVVALAEPGALTEGWRVGASGGARVER
jgi:galactokinase